MDPGEVPSAIRRLRSRKKPSRPALQEALRFLARRSCSVARLRSRLEGRGFAPAEIRAAIGELRRHGLLDDLRFAREHFRIGGEIKLRGRARLIREARDLGIPGEVISRALAGPAPQAEEHDILRRALRKWQRVHGKVETDRERRRLYRHLLRRGFEPEAILRELPPPGKEG